MIYLLIVNISLIISFVLYTLIFRKLTFFQWNRFYLIGMMIFSVLAPVGIFIELPKTEIIGNSIPMVDLSGYLSIAISNPKEQTVYLVDILTYVYWTGVAITCVLLLFRLIQLLRALGHEHDYLSFSFFNKIIIGGSIIDRGSIESHERVHVEQGHTYDLLLMELLKIFNWFNPILYFFQKELKFQHECIADDICSTDKVAYAEMLVAHALQVDNLPLTHEFSNHSFLKKRIMMLFKNKSTGRHKLLYVSILPMLLVVAGSTLVFNTSRAKGIVSEVESSINQVEISGSKGDAGSIEARKNDDHVLESTLGPEQLLQFEAVENTMVNEATGKLIVRDTINPGPNTVFTKVEIVPEPVGGMRKFMGWVSTNYEYPLAALENDANGIIEISFVVEKDGSLADFKVKRDLGYGTGEAALKLMRGASKWNPGVQNGKKVRVAYTLPIRLTARQEGRNKETAPKAMATPKLGSEGLRAWFAQNFKMPRKISSDDVDPVIESYFIINSDGTIKSLIVRSDLGKEFQDRASKLLSQSIWNPALENGDPVESRAAFFFKFKAGGGYEKNYTRVDVTPAPIGGMRAYQSYIVSNFDPPKLGSNGNVTIRFHLDKEGQPHEFKILDEPQAGDGKKLIGLIEQKGKWRPGILDGKKVGGIYELTIALEDRSQNNGGKSYYVINWKGMKYQQVKS